MQGYLNFILLLAEEPIFKGSQSGSFVFILFLLCFALCSQLFSKRGKMISSMLNGLFRINERQSIFFEATDNDLFSKLLLSLQTVVILSLFVFCWFSHEYKIPMESPPRTFLFLGGYALLFVLFFIYKWISYNVVGSIFFSKEAKSQWIESFSSLVCLSGIILFIPVLLMFYVDALYYFCYYSVLFYLFVLTIVITIKTYALFFQGRGLLLYLFLYLCAQEIIPLFLFYKGLVYLFNIVEKGTLWL